MSPFRVPGELIRGRLEVPPVDAFCPEAQAFCVNEHAIPLAAIPDRKSRRSIRFLLRDAETMLRSFLSMRVAPAAAESASPPEYSLARAPRCPSLPVRRP